MVAALVITGILLLLGGIIMLEAGDVIVGRFRTHSIAHGNAGMPFLIIPTEDHVTNVRPVLIGDKVSGTEAQRPVSHDIAIPLLIDREPHYSSALKANEGGSTTYADLPANDGATVVFRRPSDEPMYLLPGWLEIVAGDGAGEDIRLIGGMGETPHVVLGREADGVGGVTLRSRTVSRRHACMTFDEGRWSIMNLSHTNPVLVNDHLLERDGASMPLADGDRIELGEVVLRFHER